MYVAAKEGHEALVAALVAAGADVNKGTRSFSRCESGETPLHVAASNGREAGRFRLTASSPVLNLECAFGFSA